MTHIHVNPENQTDTFHFPNNPNENWRTLFACCGRGTPFFYTFCVSLVGRISGWTKCMRWLVPKIPCEIRKLQEKRGGDEISEHSRTRDTVFDFFWLLDCSCCCLFAVGQVEARVAANWVMSCSSRSSWRANGRGQGRWRWSGVADIWMRMCVRIRTWMSSACRQTKALRWRLRTQPHPQQGGERPKDQVDTPHLPRSSEKRLPGFRGEPSSFSVSKQCQHNKHFASKWEHSSDGVASWIPFAAIAKWWALICVLKYVITLYGNF